MDSRLGLGDVGGGPRTLKEKTSRDDLSKTYIARNIIRSMKKHILVSKINKLGSSFSPKSNSLSSDDIQNVEVSASQTSKDMVRRAEIAEGKKVLGVPSVQSGYSQVSNCVNDNQICNMNRAILTAEAYREANEI